MFNKLKTAIVYDWVDKWGGIERALLILCELFPNADFYTSYVDYKKAPWAKHFSLHSSFIQHFPPFIRTNRVFSLPFYPYAFESFNFDRYDLVFSISSSFAKSVITKPGTLHINYLLTPTRYLWLYPDYYIGNSFKKLLLSGYIERLKQWDYVAAQRPDHIVSISKTVASRCKEYYKRNSQIIYPPFDMDYWGRIKTNSTHPRISSPYFLLVSRLEPYKRVDLAIRAFSRLKEHSLVVVGAGSQEKRLREIAGENIHFLPFCTDEELAGLYMHSSALIMAQEEDFGYVALEAQFFGCPVIAFKKGGAQETILEGKTGFFFDRQDEESLIHAVERYHMLSYNLRVDTQKYGRNSVSRFGRDKFEEQLKHIIDSTISL